MFKKDQQSGISLISMLIAMAILVVLATYTVLILFDVSQFDLRNRAEEVVISNARFAVNKIKQDVRSASEISNPAVGETESNLTIRINGANYQYYIENDRLYRDVNDEKVALTSNQVKVLNFSATTIDSPELTGTNSVKLNFSFDWIGQVSPGGTTQYDIETTASLR